MTTNRIIKKVNVTPTTTPTTTPTLIPLGGMFLEVGVSIK